MVVHVAMAMGAWESENGCGRSSPAAMATLLHKSDERELERGEREWGTTEGAQGELDPHSALSIEQQAMAERRSAARCMEDTHQTRVAHRRISPSTWRATK